MDPWTINPFEGHPVAKVLIHLSSLMPKLGVEPPTKRRAEDSQKAARGFTGQRRLRQDVEGFALRLIFEYPALLKNYYGIPMLPVESLQAAARCMIEAFSQGLSLVEEYLLSLL